MKLAPHFLVFILSLFPMLAKAKTSQAVAASAENFFRYEGRDYRHLICLWGFAPPKQQDWYRSHLLAFPVSRIISESKLESIAPSQLRLLYFHNFDDKIGQTNEVEFSIIRNGTIIGASGTLESKDVLVLRTPPDIRGDTGWVPAFSLFFNRRDETTSSSAQHDCGAITAADATKAFTTNDNGDATGFLDWSPEIDLAWPGVLIQSVGASSGQWGLTYEWTTCTTMYSGWPRNVLQHFSTLNLGDNGQYPKDYLEFSEATGIEAAKKLARRSLETLLRYHLPSAPASWPFGIYPWKNRVWDPQAPVEGTTLDKVRGRQGVSSWLSVAFAQSYFKDDTAFSKELEEQYAACRNSFFADLPSQIRILHDSGWALQALAAHYEFTRSPADKADVATLASAMLARHRKDLTGYGSEMPQYTMGMLSAYQVLGDPAYLREAKSFVLHDVAPNLWRNRRFFDRDPKTENRDPDFVSGHWEGMQFLRLYEATKDNFFLAMTGFEWGSYEPNTWDGKSLYSRWETGPSSEANFFYLHRYAACKKYPDLYKIMQTFRGTLPQFSDWKLWPLKVTAGDDFIEINENGEYRCSNFQ